MLTITTDTVQYTVGRNNHRALNLYSALGDLTDWVYVGGTDNVNYFNKVYPINVERPEPPIFQGWCPCGQPNLVVNCWIRNKHTDEIRVIGSSCQNLFGAGRKRLCGICGGVHKNRKDNYCNTCRAKLKLQMTDSPICLAIINGERCGFEKSTWYQT